MSQGSCKMAGPLTEHRGWGQEVFYFGPAPNSQWGTNSQSCLSRPHEMVWTAKLPANPDCFLLLNFRREVA